MIDNPFALYDTDRETPIAARATEAELCEAIRAHLRAHPDRAPHLFVRVRSTAGGTLTLDGTKLLALVMNEEDR
jgi:hypothetical protein